MIPLGIRLNNPLNIVHVASNPWNGLKTIHTRPAPLAPLCEFETPVYGIRAAVVILIAYRDRHGCRVLRDFIAKWAPHNENDTDSYTRNVALWTGIPADGTFDPQNYDQCAAVVKAMIRQENGQQPYTDAQIDQGLTMAGVKPPAKALIATPAAKAGAAGIVTGAAALASSVAETIAPALPVFRQVADLIRAYPTIILGLIGLGLIVGAGWIVWTKVDERRRGLA